LSGKYVEEEMNENEFSKAIKITIRPDVIDLIGHKFIIYGN